MNVIHAQEDVLVDVQGHVAEHVVDRVLDAVLVGALEVVKGLAIQVVLILVIEVVTNNLIKQLGAIPLRLQELFLLS